MQRSCNIVLLLIIFLIFTSSLAAVTIKLASVAPEQSPWGTALNRLAAEWERVTDGEVKVIIYHNAIAGDEADILRKMRIGQLQAGVLTSSGMKQVVPEVFSVSVPFLIRSEEALNYVLTRIAPDLEELFRNNRLHVLAWSRGGWIYFFSKEPVTFPSELKPQRLASDPNDEELMQAFKIMGYRPIPMPLPELVTSLNSGLVDAFYSSPLAAAGYQSFGLAPHMLDIKIAPFLGAIIITDAAWRRIPSRFRDEFVEVARQVALDIEQDVEQLEIDAIDTMRRFGLTVTEFSESIEEAWVSDVAQYDEAFLDVFDTEMTNRVRDLLEEFGR